MHIFAPVDTIQGRLQLVSSKSISNRALILEALSGKPSVLHRLSEADDTQLLKSLLTQLEEHPHSTLHTQNCGTAFRFLTALLSTRPGQWLLTGSERMKKRPIGPLVDALLHLGADIQYTEQRGFPPLQIKGKKLRGGSMELDANLSSQFASALMMLGPTLPDGLEIRFPTKPNSYAYLEMTANLMQTFGAVVHLTNDCVSIPAGAYHSVDLTIESDWSAASYYYELAALSETADIFIEGLSQDTKQGDSRIANLMQHFGVESEFSEEGVRIKKGQRDSISAFACDLRDCPDLAPALFATCVGLGVSASFTGTSNLKIKESDRAVALALELEKTGVCSFIVNDDSVFINHRKGTLPNASITFNTHDDHRLAMAFAPLALRFSKLSIQNPEVVKKSYPNYWDDLSKLGFSYPFAD